MSRRKTLIGTDRIMNLKLIDDRKRHPFCLMSMKQRTLWHFLTYWRHQTSYFAFLSEMLTLGTGSTFIVEGVEKNRETKCGSGFYKLSITIFQKVQ